MPRSTYRYAARIECFGVFTCDRRENVAPASRAGGEAIAGYAQREVDLVRSAVVAGPGSAAPDDLTAPGAGRGGAGSMLGLFGVAPLVVLGTPAA